MTGKQANNVEKQLKMAAAAQDEKHHCILCEAEIEIAEYEIYFASGYCRYCHAELEEE